MSQRPTALVSAAGGIGDIIRITPLIRVFDALGYEVDVLLAPDYHETALLLEGAREIHRLFCLSAPGSRNNRGQIDGLGCRTYEIAVFTLWGERLQGLARYRRRLAFEPNRWKQEGDIACVREIARSVGWTKDLPAPFALASARRFGLPVETIALHPGCKPGWSWKKWHGFEALARLIPNVAIVGTPADLDNRNTYFRKEFECPSHAIDFVGKLSLPDTAALLRECAALVSNDSGLMHLAVALGTTTFGIFGLTSPGREAIPAPNMYEISKGLPCEPACRQRPWGRRNCYYRLECLKSLGEDEVLARIRSVLPNL
jgi:ADP-heptose:LPS heptosyltransferase